MTDVPGLAADKARRYAHRLLALRPLSEKEFRTRLARKGFGSDLVEAVMARVRDLGYLNDESYARQMTRSLAVNRLWGNYRIERTLQEKGIPLNLIEEALALARDEITERDAVLLLLRKKGINRNISRSDNKEKKRLMQSLMGKGFPLGLIFEILSIKGEEEVHDGE